MWDYDFHKSQPFSLSSSLPPLGIYHPGSENLSFRIILTLDGSLFALADLLLIFFRWHIWASLLYLFYIGLRARSLFPYSLLASFCNVSLHWRARMIIVFHIGVHAHRLFLCPTLACASRASVVGFFARNWRARGSFLYWRARVCFVSLFYIARAWLVTYISVNTRCLFILFLRVWLLSFVQYWIWRVVSFLYH